MSLEKELNNTENKTLERDEWSVSAKGITDFIPGSFLLSAYGDVKTGKAKSSLKTYLTAITLEITKTIVYGSLGVVVYELLSNGG